jgi:hypothetical protein
MRLGLIVGAFGALSVAAVAGWVRKPAPAPEPYAYGAAPAPPVSGTAQPTSGYDQYGQPVGSAQSSTYQTDQSNAAYAGNQTYPGNTYSGNQQYVSGEACQYPTTLPAYADRRYVRTVRSSTDVVEPVDQGPEYQGPEYRGPEYRGEVSPRGSNSYYYERRRVHHGRSTGKSVAIVAGSAGVGAAIGGIAGGGKGAGIGALAGGAGGFIYDRLTHNH